MDLKDLVPPPELCKKIPAGEFEDSALVWWGACVYPRLIPHGNRSGEVWHKRDTIPAPTLQEIMAELPDDNSCTAWFCQHCCGEWSVGNCERDLHVKNGTEDSNPAAAALKVWLEMKGIE